MHSLNDMAYAPAGGWRQRLHAQRRKLAASWRLFSYRRDVLTIPTCGVSIRPQIQCNFWDSWFRLATWKSQMKTERQKSVACANGLASLPNWASPAVAVAALIPDRGRQNRLLVAGMAPDWLIYIPNFYLRFTLMGKNCNFQIILYGLPWKFEGSS